VPWIETLSALGQLHPFFERAGFRRVGVVRRPARRDPAGYVRVWGGRRLTATTIRKSRYAEPVYYVFDNRPGPSTGQAAPRPPP
jgi:hypothetical protein